MIYELWDLRSRNMIDWTEDVGEAVEMVKAYLDADEANQIVLFVHDQDGASSRSMTGDDLVSWADTEPRASLRGSTGV